jgi:hypothetical protein
MFTRTQCSTLYSNFLCKIFDLKFKSKTLINFLQNKFEYNVLQLCSREHGSSPDLSLPLLPHLKRIRRIP